MQNNNKQFLGFNDFWLRLIGIPIVGLLVPLIFFGMSLNNPFYTISVCISIFYTALYWFICRKFFIWGNQRFTNLEQNEARVFWILTRITGVLLLFCNTCYFLIEPIFMKDIQPLLSAWEINTASFMMFFVLFGVYESRRYFTLLQKTLLEKEQIEKEHITSQLEGLKSQVNPHFLFNSLNTLISIIPEDSERSVRFVRQLSKIYRYFLDTTSEKTVPLKQEMDFVNSYTFLLKERFGESLHLDIDDKNACKDCEIIPFSLQLLLENCIKHNIVSQDKPLYINILVNKNHLTVKNNFQPKNQVQSSTGVGLKNIENRYALLSKEKIIIEKTETEFCVTLPLL